MTEPRCDQPECDEPVTWVMNCQRGWLPSCEKHFSAYTTIGESHRLSDLRDAIDSTRRLRDLLVRLQVIAE